MKQLKHLRQTLWRALLCLTVVVGFAAPGWAYSAYYVNYDTGNGWEQPQLVKQTNGNYFTCEITTHGDSKQLEIKTDNNDYFACSNNASSKSVSTTGWNALTKENKTYYIIEKPGTYTIDLEVESNSQPKQFKLTPKNGGGDVTTTDYDIYYKSSSNWSTLHKLEFNGNTATYTASMDANEEFGYMVCTKGTSTQISNGWYAKADKNTVEAGTHTYALVNSGFTNFKLPNKGGEYTFTVTRGDNGLPTQVQITTPEIVQEFPALYIGGSYKGGSWDNPAQIPDNTSTGKYNDYTIVVTAENQEFRFYDKDKNKIGPDVSDYWLIKVKDHCNGSYELKAVSKDKVYKIETPGTYTISIKEYDESAKTVKFTMTYQEPEKHLYLGATFKGNLTSPDFQLDNNGKFAPVRFTKNSNDGDFSFRFSNKEGGSANVDWIGPSINTDINLYDGNNEGKYSIGKSSQIYTIKNNGVYELQVTKWNNFDVDFTLTYIEGVDNDTPYYFVGDLNDWYSTEFDQPSGGMSMQKFLNERDAWKFRKATMADLENVESKYLKDLDNLDGWYVFDNFPEIEDVKTLTGEFQITSGGTTHLWNAQVFSLGVNNVVDGSSNMDPEKAKTVLMNPIKEDDIIFGKKFGMVHGRYKNTPAVAFSNFHLECNAVQNAKIFFKPGTEDRPGEYNTNGNDWYTKESKFNGCEIVVTGKPKNYYIFYAYKESEATDAEKQALASKPSGEEVKAKINTGKPNSNNYFLPGIKYHSSNNVVPSIGIDGNTIEHMNVNGVYLKELSKFKQEEGTAAYLKGLQDLDSDVADLLSTEGKLPNGRTVGDFDRLFYVRIPAGFENPAGWKYNLGLQEAIYNVDLEKSVAVACNHIYFLPGIDGVSVHINDDDLRNAQWEYIEDGEKKTEDMSDYDIHYYYRIYYSKPTGNNSYEIRVVDHQAGNIIPEGGDKVLYTSGVDTRKNTLEETGDKRDYGWKSLNAHTSADEANATLIDGKNDNLSWNHLDGNNTLFKDAKDKWHITWVESTDNQMRRLRIPQAHSNAYVQILAIFYKKDNAYNPYNKARKSVVSRAGSTIETVEGESVADAIAHADRLSIEPGALTFENDRYHHPLQGNHLYYALSSNGHVWTGVEEIEDDLIVDADDAEVNAASVYYNLQGVRVAEPTKGIFIEVRGNKSRKVAY